MSYSIRIKEKDSASKWDSSQFNIGGLLKALNKLYPMKLDSKTKRTDSF